MPGQTVTFTLTVTDTGQTPYTGATVTGTLNLLDDATYHNDAAATSGTVSYASPVITWTGDLAVGRLRGHHLDRHREQPRHRRQEPRHRRRLDRPRQQLPAGQLQRGAAPSPFRC